VNILQIAPALHGAKMQTTQGTHPIVVWAIIQNDDGSRDVIGLSLGDKAPARSSHPTRGPSSPTVRPVD
jgi:hypothetical protein